MTFLRSRPGRRAASVLAAGAAAWVATAAPVAHAESCFPPPPTFVVPSTTDAIDGDAVAQARSAVPPDVRPRAILRSASCAPLDPDATLLVTQPGGEGVISGETVRTSLGDSMILELDLPTALAPSSSYELCVDGADGRYCVAFQTLDGPAEPPQPPTLELGDAEAVEDGEYLVVSASAETSWTPFVGVTWMEVRSPPAQRLPTMLSFDATARTDDRAIVSGAARAGEDVCFVAVARAANGDTAESAPSCVEAMPPPDTGCSVATAPRSSSGGGALALAVALGGAIARRARRRS